MKKFKGITVLFILALFVGKNVAAQYYFYDDEYYDRDILFEAGASINAMNSLTDLAGKKGIGQRFLKDLNAGETHISGGLFFGAIYKNAIAARVEGTFGKISNRDELLVGITDIAKQRYNRNLDFRSNIYEISGTIEIHPVFMFINWARRDDAAPRYSPYVLGGVGYFSFNPQGTIPGTKRWVNLQPLHTEGQGFPTHPEIPDYKLKQINFPVGAGIKYELSRLFNARFEVIHRFTKTDYLDDLSGRYIDPAEFDKYLSPNNALLARTLSDKQINPVAIPSTGRKRGDPFEKDGYFTINLKMSLIIGRDKSTF